MLPRHRLLVASLGVWAVAAVAWPLATGTFWVVEAAVLLTPTLTVPLVLGSALSARRWLPGLAGLAVTAVAAADPPAPLATAGAITWFLWCVVLLLWPILPGGSDLLRPEGGTRAQWIARCDPGRAFLAFGALLLVFSRGGWLTFGPVHIGEPLMLLGCAHFTVAGFGLLALIDAATTGEPHAPRRARGHPLDWSRWLAISGAVLVGIGHMAGRMIELTGTVVLTASIALLSIQSWRRASGADPFVARLLRASAVAPILSMALALHYAVALTRRSAHLPYDVMVVAHGLVNLLVLVTAGIVGWRATAAPASPRREPARDRRGS